MARLDIFGTFDVAGLPSVLLGLNKLQSSMPRTDAPAEQLGAGVGGGAEPLREEDRARLRGPLIFILTQ